MADFENFTNFSKCRKSCITICITVCITLAILGEKFRIFKNLSGAEKRFCITICITVALEIGSCAINANPALIQGQEVHLYNHIRY